MSSQTATILVTDLVASTELRARLGEEPAERLRRVHERLLRTSVEAHGGLVVKGLGDGMLASFPETTGAVAAAVAIQQAADAHTRRHPELPIVVRVGLSAGDVTVETDGDHFGSPVIEATRLCAAAEGGCILAADVVRILARGRGGYTFTAMGEVELKGLTDPVAITEVRWERRPSAAPGLPFPEFLEVGDDLGFAGRTSELELLTTAWKEAAAGGRRRLVLSGDPGVGKTRLAGELARCVHQWGGAVLYGRCEEDHGVPYEPFVVALTFFCEHTPPEELRSRLGRYPGELSRLVPELADLIPGLDPPLRSDPETQQYRLFEAVSSWLGAAGEAAGLLLVVDDLHWAPPPTLHLFAHVLRATGPARLLVLGAFRDTEVGPAHPLSTVLADLRRTAGVERISLEGLSVGELSELLDALPKGQVGRALAATLHEGTKGNPFFVGEVLRDIAEWGSTVETLPVPEGVREVTVSRVARLDPTTRRLLGVAAVLGRDVELAPLAAIAGVDEDTAVEALESALTSHLVEEARVGVYRFVHTLVRSALYDTLSATKRARLHLRAADVFEETGGEDAARLAHHLVASAPLGDSTRTARACLAAGDRALSMLADTEAGDWYSQGLAFLTGAEDPHLRIDLLTGLGEAQRRTGDAAFRQTLLGAARLAAGRGDADRLVRAVLANNRGLTSVIGNVDADRLSLIDSALELVGPQPTGDRAELLAIQAVELVFADDLARSLQAVDEAAAIAARLDDVNVRARVGVRRLLACLVPDRVTALVSEGNEIVRFADASGNPQLRALSRAGSLAALLMTGQLEEARRRATEAMAIADETGQPGLRSMAHSFYAGALDAVGEHEMAAHLTQVALELAQQAAIPDAGLWYGARMWVDWTFTGEAAMATDMAAQGFAEYPRNVILQGAWALDLALTGRKQELADFLSRLTSDLPGVPVDLFWPATHFLFAMAQGFGVENQQAADALYRLLLPYRSLHAAYGIGHFGPLDVALGVLARVLGDVERALVHHEAAAAAIEACGAARAPVFNDYQWAVSLLARDAPGDRQRAAGMLGETLAYCHKKGYTTFVAKTEDLLATL